MCVFSSPLRSCYPQLFVHIIILTHYILWNIDSINNASGISVLDNVTVTYLHSKIAYSYFLSGYGVFTTVDFQQGEFLLDYVGNLMSQSEADQLSDQTYVYNFQIGPLKYR